MSSSSGKPVDSPEAERVGVAVEAPGTEVDLTRAEYWRMLQTAADIARKPLSGTREEIHFFGEGWGMRYTPPKSCF